MTFLDTNQYVLWHTLADVDVGFHRTRVHDLGSTRETKAASKSVLRAKVPIVTTQDKTNSAAFIILNLRIEG